MCTPISLVTLFLCAGLVLIDAESCTSKDDCLKKLLLFENELNSISRLNEVSSNLLPPKDAGKLNSLYEMYQRKYLDSKRDVNRNFQTQGWK